MSEPRRAWVEATKPALTDEDWDQLARIASAPGLSPGDVTFSLSIGPATVEECRALFAEKEKTDVSEPQPQDPIALQYMRALDYIHERLGKLEKNLGNDIGTTENARLLHRSIEATKHWKQPEFSDRFGSGKEDGA